MKKIILCFIFLLLLSGCSVEYNLNITKDDFQETTTLLADKNLADTEKYQDISIVDIFKKIDHNYYEPIYFNDERYDYYVGGMQPNVNYYEVKPYQLNEYVGVSFNHNFKLNDIYRSNAIKQCFEELTIQNSDNFILFRTNNKCDVFDKYPLLENIVVKISTPLEVIASNADKVENNTYIWNIDKDNYHNKAVRLTYDLKKGSEIPDIEKEDEEKEVVEEKEEKKKNNKYNIVIILVSFIILGVVLGLVIKYKKVRL